MVYSDPGGRVPALGSFWRTGVVVNKLEELVVKWWKFYRPNHFTELDHIKNPTVNVGWSADKALAIVASKIATKHRQRRFNLK